MMMEGKQQRRLNVLQNQLKVEKKQEKIVEQGETAGKTYVPFQDEDVKKSMKLERMKGTFSSEEMETLLCFESEKVKREKHIFLERLSKGYLGKADKYDLSTLEKKELTLKQGKEIAREFKIWQEEPREIMKMKLAWLRIASSSAITFYGVHFMLFYSAIDQQGNEEQKAKYLPAARDMRIIGCYACTELGHGSYVRGFHTTATFNKEDDTFTLHSPSLIATKWWIGGAGKHATYSVVLANLIIDDKNYGIHSFIVPIRSQKDHKPMPGIFIGDMGEKMGRNGIDNGYIRFDKVKIPRENMLNRFANVSKQGEYTQPPLAQLSYGSLLTGRVAVLSGAVSEMERALTIAIRYSAMRRQFKSAKSNEETKLLDYRNQQWQLFPRLAGCFVHHVATNAVDSLYYKYQEDLKQNGAKYDPQILADIHGLSSGLKAFFTSYAKQTIEACRFCLGGNGFIRYTGLADQVSDYAAAEIFEGINPIVLLQTARQLVKYTKAILTNGEKARGLCSYLNELKDLQKYEIPSDDEFYTYSNYVTLFKYRVFYLAKDLAGQVAYDMKKDKTTDLDMDRYQVDLIHIAEAHVQFYVVQAYVEWMNTLKDKKTFSKSIYMMLDELFKTYLMKMFIDNANDFTINGLFKKSHFQEFKKRIFVHFDVLRPNAMTIVDSFGIPDWLVASPVGEKDGNIYEKLFKRVIRNPGSRDVPPYYMESMHPTLSQGI